MMPLPLGHTPEGDFHGTSTNLSQKTVVFLRDYHREKDRPLEDPKKNGFRFFFLWIFGVVYSPGKSRTTWMYSFSLRGNVS